MTFFSAGLPRCLVQPPLLRGWLASLLLLLLLLRSIRWQVIRLFVVTLRTRLFFSALIKSALSILFRSIIFLMAQLQLQIRFLVQFVSQGHASR